MLFSSSISVISKAHTLVIPQIYHLTQENPLRLIEERVSLDIRRLGFQRERKKTKQTGFLRLAFGTL